MTPAVPNAALQAEINDPGYRNQFPGFAFGAAFGFTGTSFGATSYSGFDAPISQRSNHPTKCCNRSTRCHGCPERESSCVSFGNFTITVGTFRNFKARNICSPPAPEGVRVSVSPRINIIGVFTSLM